MKTARLTSFAIAGLMLAVVGCGSSGGVPTGTGGSSGTGGTSGTNGTGGATQTTEYSFTLGTTALSLPLGGTQDVTVTIDRGSPAFTGAITFTLEVPDSITGNGVTAAIAPNPATANATTITVDVASTGVAAGSYTLAVVGTSGAQTYTLSLPLTVTSAATTTLLVDADYSDNNQDQTNVNATPSPSDTLFPTLLQNEAIAFNTFVVPATDAQATTPASSVLTSYSTIVWYTGNTYGGVDTTVSPAQQAILEAWLDQGGHTLLIFSQNLVYDLRKGDWDTEVETNTFLANYIGAVGSADDGDLDHATYNVTGVAGTALGGKVFQVIADQPIGSSGDTINPAAGTDVLGTVVSDADGALSVAAPIPIVVGNLTAGTAGTSRVVYVGAPIENILMTAGNNTNAQLFHGILIYLGIDAS